jgi:hypothetical protein
MKTPGDAPWAFSRGQTPGGQGQENLSPWFLPPGPRNFFVRARGRWGGHKGTPVASAGFAKTQSHALRRTSFCSTADKLVSQLASLPVGDLRVLSHFLKWDCN